MTNCQRSTTDRMSIRKQVLPFSVIVFSVLAIALTGCSGGGSSTTTTPAPSLEVTPASLDFGIITKGNEASILPLAVVIKNGGSIDLAVTEIALTDVANFDLDVNGGASPCGSALTLEPGNSCTVAINFFPGSFGDFSELLEINSNDPTKPNYSLSLKGKYEDISEINVKINQIDACPRLDAKIYVSVTDQGGFAVQGLKDTNFTLVEAGNPLGKPNSAVLIVDDTTLTLSVALLMDYSGSITDDPKNVEDMESAAIGFVNQMGSGDEAQIIKFAKEYQVAQGPTSDKEALIAAINSDPGLDPGTLLYDTLVAATDLVSQSQKVRKAIILITDGVDFDPVTGLPISNAELSDVISAANQKGIPVFTVGLGEAVDPPTLKQIANETGGVYYDAPTSGNLLTIYQRLADLLFIDQYVLFYASALNLADTGDLEVTAKYNDNSGLQGSDVKQVPNCPE